jgi:hypothetical protein
MCMEIESRSIQSVQLEVKNPKTLYQQLLKILNDGYDANILLTNQSKIRNLLKLTDNNPQSDESEIVGGSRNFKRLKELPNFERRDGCWFDFAITVRKVNKSAEIIGFNFEIRFPESVPVKFLRFDFNLPDHNNEDRGMRFHVHPGNDDFMINAPPMSPVEILHLFLYGLVIPEKPRS